MTTAEAVAPATQHQVLRQNAQQYLTPLSNEQWNDRFTFYADMGYVECSVSGCTRWVSPNFIRVMPDGTKVALCPDRQGKHKMQMGPTAYDSFLRSYSNARPIFDRGQILTRAEVEAIIDDGDQIVTVAELRPEVNDLAEAVAERARQRAAEVREANRVADEPKAATATTEKPKAKRGRPPKKAAAPAPEAEAATA